MKLLQISILLFVLKSVTLAQNITIEWYEDASLSLKNWSEAKSYCQDLRVDEKSDWRLPSISELELAYDARGSFSNIESGFYWSSTEHELYLEHAWSILFYNGDINYYNKDTKNHILCLRDIEQVAQKSPDANISLQKRENNASKRLLIKSY